MNNEQLRGQMGTDHRGISGLGLEFADLLPAQRINLVLAARRQEPMEKLATNLRRKYGADVLVKAIDLASPGAPRRLKSNLDARSMAIRRRR